MGSGGSVRVVAMQDALPVEAPRPWPRCPRLHRRSHPGYSVPGGGRSRAIGRRTVPGRGRQQQGSYHRVRVRRPLHPSLVVSHRCLHPDSARPPRACALRCGAASARSQRRRCASHAQPEPLRQHRRRRWGLRALARGEAMGRRRTEGEGRVALPDVGGCELRPRPQAGDAGGNLGRPWGARKGSPGCLPTPYRPPAPPACALPSLSLRSALWWRAAPLTARSGCGPPPRLWIGPHQQAASCGASTRRQVRSRSHHEQSPSSAWSVRRCFGCTSAR